MNVFCYGYGLDVNTFKVFAFLCVFKYFDIYVIYIILKQKLEETCEALQRATEAEISLRDKYVCLEEKQTQKKEQSEVTSSVIVSVSNTVK